MPERVRWYVQRLASSACRKESAGCVESEEREGLRDRYRLGLATSLRASACIGGGFTDVGWHVVVGDAAKQSSDMS